MTNKLKFTIADYYTLTGLLFAWYGIILLIEGSTNIAIVMVMIAFVFDLLDGFTARKISTESKFGRELDSYVDIIIYLVFSVLLFHLYLSPNLLVSIVVGFMILGFGGLRLIRFNSEGIKQQNGKDYYRGLTVVHILFLTLICYFLSQFTNYLIGYLPALLLIVVSPFMLSNYRSYKTTNYWLFAFVIISIIVTSLLLN